MFTEALPPFFADFGADATLNGQTVRGILDYQTVDSFGIIANTQPTFTCPLSAVAALPTAGDTLTLDAASYSVADVRPDGTGILVLALKR